MQQVYVWKVEILFYFKWISENTLYISYIVQILVQNDQGDLVIKITSETKKKCWIKGLLYMFLALVFMFCLYLTKY